MSFRGPPVYVCWIYYLEMAYNLARGTFEITWQILFVSDFGLKLSVLHIPKWACVSALPLINVLDGRTYKIRLGRLDQFDDILGCI